MDVKLVVAEGAARSQTFRLRNARTLIGRQKGSGLRIPSSSVSRRHSQLTFANGQLSVADLDSANGTFVNGRRISKTTVLQPGDRLQIGDIVFVVKYRLPQEIQRPSQEDEEVHIPEVVEVVEEVVEEGDEDIEEAIPLSDEHAASPFEVEIEESSKRGKAERGKPAKAERAKAENENPDAGKFLDKPWNAPASDDLRDILSRMEKENKKR